MKHILILIISLLLTPGCNTKKPEFSSIEFIDFSWSYFDAKTGNEVPLFFKCYKYAYINKDGQAKVFVYNNSRPKAFHYHKGQVDPGIIQSFESFSSQRGKDSLDSLYFEYIKLPSDINEAPRIYDGTYLKVRSNYNDGSSILYNFVNDDYSPIIKPLYDKILDIANTGTDSNFEDIEKFDSTIFSFIKDAIHEDLKFRLKIQFPKSLQIEIPIRVLKKDTIIDFPE